MKAVVSEKGQVTIPKRLRDRLGIRPGEVIDFEVEGGRLIGAKAGPSADKIASLWGLLGHGGDSDALIEEMRGPVDGQ